MPLALTLPPEAPGPVQPARPLGETAAHMPPAGGAAGVGWAGAPRRAAAAASWGRPGGRMRSCDRAGAQLSESAGKLRGSAAARSAARVAGSGQRRLHARSGRRASFGPSPAPRAPGHGGAAAAAAAGVPRAPGRPSLHRGSPRAHWPRRGDHRGGVPCGLPSHRPPHTPRAPDREGAEGRGPAPHRPARRRGLAPSQRYPASATQPAPACPSGPRFCRIARAGWGRVAGEGAGAGREQQRHSPGAVGAPLSRWRGAEPGHRRSSPGGPGHSWPSEDPGSPLAPGYFPQPSVHGRRLNLALVWLPCKNGKVGKVLEFMRSRL